MLFVVPQENQRAPRITANALTREILHFLFRNRIFAWRANTTGIFDPTLRKFRTSPKKGVSDILAIVPPTGKLLAIEIKMGKDRLSPEQEGFLLSVKQAGGLSFVAHDFESFISFFNSL